MDKLDTLELFCEAAKARSFTVAAVTLGTTPSAISKAVRRLETQLGIRLFERSTRAVRLTDEGAAYHEVCRSALANIRSAETALSSSRSSPRGLLRVSLPYSYGIKRVIPLLPEFVDRHADQVRVTVSLSNANVDFVKQEFDMAVRLGHVADSRLVARPLHEAKFRTVASPHYLRRYGLPSRPEDLPRHSCLGLTLPDSGRTMPWVFAVEGSSREVEVGPRMNFDHPLGVLAAALHDAGIARLLDFTVDDDIRHGRLTEVLVDFQAPPLQVFAVYPRGRQVPARVRAFLDFLIERGGSGGPRTQIAP